MTTQGMWIKEETGSEPVETRWHHAKIRQCWFDKSEYMYTLTTGIDEAGTPQEVCMSESTLNEARQSIPTREQIFLAISQGHPYYCGWLTWVEFLDGKEKEMEKEKGSDSGSNIFGSDSDE